MLYITYGVGVCLFWEVGDLEGHMLVIVTVLDLLLVNTVTYICCCYSLPLVEEVCSP
jgi:hypothetical protein